MFPYIRKAPIRVVINGKSIKHVSKMYTIRSITILYTDPNALQSN